MPIFNIVQVAEPGSPLLQNQFGFPYAYNDGALAAREAKRLAKELGIKLSAKIAIDRFWRDREQGRFDNDEYVRLPWADEDWWYDARNLCPEIATTHFAHISQQRSGMIAYTASEEDGSKDKQTLVKPSKYLERFCAKSLRNYGLDPRRVAARFCAQFAPVELKFAATAEDIQRVYEQGPESCMSREIGAYNSKVAQSGVHPVTIYAAGDLQVAYLESKSEEGDETFIIARSLVWPEKKTHSRIYGDIHRMAAALKDAGYAFGAPIGAKMRRVLLPGNRDRFIAPYVDAGSSSGAGSLVAHDKGTHLVIGRKSPKREYYACNQTGGYTESPRRGVQCTECDELMDEGNLYHVRLSCDSDDYRAVCPDCVNDVAWQSLLDGVFYDHNTTSPVIMDDGSRWTSEQFIQHGAVCGHSGRKCEKSRMIQMFNGVKWSRTSFRSNGFTCELSGGHYPRDQMVYTVEGWCVARTVALKNRFQCDTCSRFEHVEQRSEVSGTCMCSRCDSDSKLRAPQSSTSYTLTASTALPPQYTVTGRHA